MKRARCRPFGLRYAALSSLAASRRVSHRSRGGVFGGQLDLHGRGQVALGMTVVDGRGERAQFLANGGRSPFAPLRVEAAACTVDAGQRQRSEKRDERVDGVGDSDRILDGGGVMFAVQFQRLRDRHFIGRARGRPAGGARR